MMRLPLTDGIERIELEIGRGRMAAVHMRARGTKRGTAAMVPGYFGTKEDFRFVLPLLTAQGYDCWAFDYVDYFREDGLSDFTDYTLDKMAGDLQQAIATVGEPVHLIGHCLGGLVARAMTVTQPGTVRSLALLNCGPHMKDPRHKLIFAGMDRTFTEKAGAMAMWPVVQRLLPRDDAILGAFWKEKLASLNYAFVKGASLSMREQPDQTDALTATGIPTLVMYGKRDRRLWSHDMYRAMADRLGAAEVVIDDAAHSPHLEQPQATATAILDLWSRVPHGVACP